MNKKDKIPENLVLKVSQEAADTCSNFGDTKNCLLATSVKLRFPNADIVSAGCSLFDVVYGTTLYSFQQDAKQYNDSIGTEKSIFGCYHNRTDDGRSTIIKGFVPFTMKFNLKLVKKVVLDGNGDYKYA